MSGRKRTSSGNIKSNDSVYVPFKTRIPAGHCTFTINVPKIYSERKYFFATLVLMPDFYSTEAAIENLEDPEEKSSPINYEIQLKASFLRKSSLYPEEFVMPNSVTTTGELAVQINAFFEVHKPAAVSRLGCFFDWKDLLYSEETGLTWDEWVRQSAIVYYGEPFDENKHFNALPVSARTIHGCNNYLFPTKMSEFLRENLRFRFWLAPNTDALFSTDGQLKAMGFGENQIGERTGKSKFIMTNDNTTEFNTIIADEEPHRMVEKTTPFKLSLQVHSTSYMSETVNVSITKGESFENASYVDMMKKGLETLSYQSNLKLNMSYNASAKKFKFSFPTHDSIALATLIVPSDLAERLGFGLTNDITGKHNEGDRVEDQIDISKTETKARALGYDTGMIVVTCDGKTSNRIAGISDYFMCTLYPTPTGTFEMSLMESFYIPSMVKLPHYYSSASGEVPITFRLYRLLDNNQPIKLDWKNGAFLSGQFLGVEEV